jgi:DHA2 family multidrug resistance protein-like MFS transporter
VMTVGNELIITTAPPERAGAASALSETSAELSGALGIAVLGSAGMLLFRLWLGPAVPAGLDPADTTRALATLGGAMSVAGGLADGGAFGDAARTAFTDAMRVVAVFGMAMMLVAAWMAQRLMRDGGEAPVADAGLDEVAGA